MVIIRQYVGLVPPVIYREYSWIHELFLIKVNTWLNVDRNLSCPTRWMTVWKVFWILHAKKGTKFRGQT